MTKGYLCCCGVDFELTIDKPSACCVNYQFLASSGSMDTLRSRMTSSPLITVRFPPATAATTAERSTMTTCRRQDSRADRHLNLVSVELRYERTADDRPSSLGNATSARVTTVFGLVSRRSQCILSSKKKRNPYSCCRAIHISRRPSLCSLGATYRTRLTRTTTR